MSWWRVTLPALQGPTRIETRQFYL